MSQSPPNYMDGVPVKISEQYKPPPKVSLPQSLIQRMANPQIMLANVHVDYNFNLERTVYGKIIEWDTVRQQERCNRCERMRRRQEERRKQLEEKQKQMLTAVSYPSTEDLSSDDGGDSGGNNEENTIDDVTPLELDQSNLHQTISQKSHFSPPNFDTILMPTIAPGSIVTNFNKSDFVSIEMNRNHYDQKHTNLNKINYSDFENDTSSPFDNIELKTINDLDILAQVLNTTKVHSNETSDDTQASSTRSSSEDTTTTDENVKNENVSKIDTGIGQQQQLLNQSINSNLFYQQQQQQQQQHQHQNVYSFQDPSTTVHQQQQQQQPTNYNQYLGQYYTYYGPMTDFNNYSHQTSTSIAGPTSCLPNFTFSSVGGGGSLDQSTIHPPNSQNYAPAFRYDRTTFVQGTDSLMQVQQHAQLQSPLKAKSVPDILKELNDEVRDSQMRRVRNNSQSVAGQSDDTKKEPITGQVQSNGSKSVEQTFSKLSISAQKLAQSISSMGFPLERVSRVAEKFGKDDKKIVEHLIPLSELLDLGFEESKISEALIKFDNNKEKALDFLIS